MKRIVLAAAILGAAWNVQAAPGDLDMTWGDAGISSMDSGVYEITEDRLGATVVDAASRVYQVSMALGNNAGEEASSIVRFLSDGSVDPSYGAGGIVALGGGQHPYVATVAAVQQDGKLLVGGYAQTGPNQVFVCRLDVNGNLDPSFIGKPSDLLGCTTNVNTPWLATNHNEVEAILVQSNGRVVVINAVTVINSGEQRLAATRLLPNGARDPSFGDVTLPAQFRGGISFGNEHRMNIIPVDAALSSNNKITIAGDVQNTSNRDFHVVQLTADGALNGAFGQGGVRRIPFNKGGSNTDIASSIAIGPSQSIYVAGSVSVGSSEQIGIAKLTATGALDNGFGTAGRATPAICDVCFFAEATDVLVQGDGKPVVVAFAAGEGFETIGVTRLLANGVQDQSFGGAGVALYNVFGSEDDMFYYEALDLPATLVSHQQGILVGGWGHTALEPTASDLFQFKIMK